MKPVEYYLKELDKFFHSNLYSCERFDADDCLQEQRLAVLLTYNRIKENNAQLEEGQIFKTLITRAAYAVKDLLSKQGHLVSFPSYRRWAKYKDSTPIACNMLMEYGASRDNNEEKLYVKELMEKFDEDNVLDLRSKGYKFEEIAEKINRSKTTAFLRLKKIKGRMVKELKKNDI